LIRDKHRQEELRRSYDVLMGRESWNFSAVEPEYPPDPEKDNFTFALDLAERLGQYGRPFVTEHGHMGFTNGVAKSQEGDVVCLFPGCHVPYILRQEGENFRFIEACHLHGSMGEQLGEELIRSNRRMEEFRIK
jgi:hypothetical protein